MCQIPEHQFKVTNMSGGFPIKCDFCEVKSVDFNARRLLAVLADEFGLLTPLPASYSSKATSAIFQLTLDKDDRITRSIPIPANELPLKVILDQVREHQCARLESQILIEGRGLDSQITLCRRGLSGPMSISVVFPLSEQVLPLLQDVDLLHSVQEFLIEIATAGGSTGFLVDYHLPDDPDVEFIRDSAIVDHLTRTAAKSTRSWRGRSRPGLIVGVRDGLTTPDAVRAAWGPSAKIFASRGFVGLSLV